MSYFPTDAREPLHHGSQRQHQGGKSHPHQAPQHMKEYDAAATNPILLDDDAFHKASETLLNKVERSKLTGERYIYSTYMLPLERSQFAEAFARRYRDLPTFPAPDESITDRYMRRLEKEFGKAFLRVTVSPDNNTTEPTPTPREYNPSRQGGDASKPYSHPHHEGYNRWPSEGPEYVPEYQQQKYEAPRYNPRHNPRYNRQQMVHSPQSEYTNYRDDSAPPAYAPPSYNKKTHPQHQQYGASAARRQNSFDSSRAPTPTSILKKYRPMTRHQVAQIIEVLPPAATKPLPAKKAPGSSKKAQVLSTQSSTRQVLMQEIEYTTQLLESANSDDQSTYKTHLSGLKRQLKTLMTKESKSKTTSSNSDVLEIDQVLEPKKERVIRATTTPAAERVVEMEKVPTRGRSKVTERRSLSKSPGRSRSRSRSRSKSRERSKRSLQTSGLPSFEEQASPLRMEQFHIETEEVVPTIPKVIHALSTQENSPVATNQKVAIQSPTVRVTAPANLPAGYQLDAEYENQAFVVTVPQGGVTKGQVFESAATPARPAVAGPVSQKTYPNSSDEGKWKGGILDCCVYGVDHPMFCHSFFCPQVAMAQIMTRMKLSAYGERTTSAGSRLRMKTVVLLSSCFIVLNLLLIGTMAGSSMMAAKIFAGVVFGLMNAPAVFAFCHVVVHTRRSIRATEHIPEQPRFEGFEDLLVSIWCIPCTVAQMMRQTADYDTYRAVWFSESGLPNHVFVNKDEPTMMPTKF